MDGCEVEMLSSDSTSRDENAALSHRFCSCVDTRFKPIPRSLPGCVSAVALLLPRRWQAVCCCCFFFKDALSLLFFFL